MLFKSCKDLKSKLMAQSAANWRFEKHRLVKIEDFKEQYTPFGCA